MDSETPLNQSQIPDLYRQYFNELVAFCFGFFKNPEEAVDMAQDTFYKALRHLQDGPKSIQNPRAWLYQIARNHCLNRLRDTKIDCQKIDCLLEAETCSTGGEENMIHHMMLKSILTSIETILPELEKTIFRLRFVHEMNLDEISNVLGIHTSNVSRKLNKILETIGTHLDKIRP